MCPPSKTSYHHGDLRQALVNAAIQLVTNHGPNQFSMADACRIAGVSKAAPYRHFANKNALLKEVVQQGFLDMRQSMEKVLPQSTPGSNQRIAAIGMAYIHYAMKMPQVFKLMFGNTATLEFGDDERAGKSAFQILLDEVILRTKETQEDQLMKLAFPLWTLVHGAALLIIDNAYERIYPNTDVNDMIITTTAQVLNEYPEP